ncbi:hypothetical protein LOTGIDRAFT_135458 [Lottia gigantea]|uniref:Cleavage and polyadenylation specificity factor subunit 4 n=1 Tax=Lottia gigantea TaxID=225164 RepID=V4B1B4_LOTGI|nr:hypothetical protein LOTGIDRAFT_135458 [Lottia gigantea]ESO81999.1 hypothetical protein LOTGIDRAFT_135458 [Lottia gigantea]
MQEVVAPTVHLSFDIEYALEQQIGAQVLPFPGMDKSGAGTCTFYLVSGCNKGTACPFRHVRGDRTVVCKHWLRGLCKKGDDCEFLHEYDMTKMPECYFFSKFGQCSNKECPFLHIDPEKKIKDCPWYDRGFCRHGPNCKNRHQRRVLCISYVNGFCLDGANCKFVHPKFDLPVTDNSQQVKKGNLTCHFCGEYGHKAIHCNKMPNQMRNLLSSENITRAQSRRCQRRTRMAQISLLRPLDQVTCYKCGEKGHYANKCNKGHLAFLSQNAQNVAMMQPVNT